MTIEKNKIAIGTHIRVQNGPATKKFLSSGGRVPFFVWPPGDIWKSESCNDGDEFIICSGRNGRIVYKYPEVSSKFITLKRVSDETIVETYYINVRFDASLVKQ